MGNVTEDRERSTQRCANMCSVHDWCGAFYLSQPTDSDGGKCRMVPEELKNNTENIAAGSESTRAHFKSASRSGTNFGLF